MNRGGGMKLARAFFAILAWIGGVGSSPVFGHAHGSSSTPHSHAAAGFLDHDHPVPGFEADHDDVPQMEESVFHLHTAWMGMPFSLATPEGSEQEGKISSTLNCDAYLVHGNSATRLDPAVGSPLTGPACWTLHVHFISPSPLRPGPSTPDGLRQLDATCLRSMNLRC
ncbi:MAG: hypothetical protein BGO49_27575 [Planctomycetales bacterium 71-10]|nr:MAG: hypothetical protein BGO49_27575 [Planctomycetales bacterium 71-10]